MTELRGIAASPGIAIGPVHLHRDEGPSVPQYRITHDTIPDEKERLSMAVARASEDLERIRDTASSSLREQEAQLLETHLMMLSDPTFFESIHERLEKDLQNIEWILDQTMQEVVRKLARSDSEYLSERGSDIHDVSKRVLGHLISDDSGRLSKLDSEIVLVTHDLLPSDAVAMDKRKVRAIAMDAGGRTSHTAIIARSFEIPAVVGLSEVSAHVAGGELIIVDGNRGVVVIDPDDPTLDRYREQQSEWRRREVELMRLHDLPAETRDGKLIYLKGNIEFPEEVDGVLSHGADGIGLYRSEFLFLKGDRAPTEDEQYEAYREVLEAMAPRPVTIRTLDVGGDKVLSRYRHLDEKNPLLGWRAIRVCLAEKELFETQLRALVRAGRHGNLRIMFPMISGMDELNLALDTLARVRHELKGDDGTSPARIPTGMMIEVPSAAMTSDLLARKVDFFSIGTNDLIQYSIAVDRGNERVAYLYEPFHPGVLRLVRMTIESAHREGIPVAMCGEMAGDPLATLVLLGLGLDEFSMSSVMIPEIKRIIRGASIADAEELAGRVMEMRSAKEILNLAQRQSESESAPVVS